MQVAGLALRASKVTRAHPFSVQSLRAVSLFPGETVAHSSPTPCRSPSQWRTFSSSSLQNLRFSWIGLGNDGILLPNDQLLHPMCTKISSASFFSAPVEISGKPSEAVKEFYDKILNSVKEKRTAPPNAWLWSLISNCQSKDDVQFLFDVLHHLRVFRLSNLRIADNFNSNLCLEVTKACIRVKAFDHGKKTLCKHNIYGLSPTIGSANAILSYAKTHKNQKLMADVMELLKKSDLPLQPATADIVFSICLEVDNWKLITKYSRRFLKSGVKLRKTTFGSWMEFAVRRGDTGSLWKIEKMRSELYKEHTVKSGISCAKGLLLERKPEDAATVIQVVHQMLPDKTKPETMTELQKLVSEWPSDVVKHQKNDNKKELAAVLTADIPAMFSHLLNMGVETTGVNTEDLKKTEAILS